VRRRTAAACLVAVVGAASAGCAAAPPQVTFAAGAATVQAGPTQYCEVDLSGCADPGTPAKLAVPAGTALQISVPQEVSSTPWHVVFSYRDDTGQQVDERSGVFPPNAATGYTLQLPTATAQLVEAQVQEFGAAEVADPATQETQFAIRASWVLQAGG
jgi:Protein of unknown function (DUF2771)